MTASTMTSVTFPSNELSWTSTAFNKSIAFTTPHNYASRFARLSKLHGFKPIWCPTIVVETTPQTMASIQPYLLSQNLDTFSAIAFTSRAGISAFSQAITQIQNLQHHPLSPSGETFTISALGKDAELLDQDFLSKLCQNPNRIRVLVPPIATPAGLVESLELGLGRRILCPVPLVAGLDEPPVVPNFLKALAEKAWLPVKVSAYETRWAGFEAVQGLLRNHVTLDAIVFTSTGEVEGFLKSLRELGLDCGVVKEKWPRLVVAAHGPVTAAGAERLGVHVDVVSSKFGSFGGVLEALILHWEASNSEYF